MALPNRQLESGRFELNAKLTTAILALVIGLFSQDIFKYKLAPTTDRAVQSGTRIAFCLMNSHDRAPRPASRRTT